jgi:radical SAM superfamily enzyme YgiQ (UPF0313 family)
MRICLIGAPTISEFADRKISPRESWGLIAEHAPLGILSLAAVLEERGFRPQVLDLNRLYYRYASEEGTPKNSPGAGDFCRFAAAHLPASGFDFCGLSTVCSSYPLTLRLAGEIKRLYPKAIVALGGPQASVVDLPTMRAYSFVDLIVRGEAEESLPRLLEAIEQNQWPSLIPGITFRRGSEIVRAPEAPVVNDLDSLPFPAFHLLPRVEGARYLPLELGRGCPFACTFCSTNDFFRRKFRLKSPHRVIEEMRQARQRYGVSSFDLIHDMFTIDRKRVVEFSEAMIQSGEAFSWGSSARTDCIDEPLLALMSKAGCRGLFFGIETGSPRLQKIIDKRLDLSQAAAHIAACDRLQIKTAVSLIAGFPEETLADLAATTGFFVDSLRYDHAVPQLSLLAPLAGTPIHRQHQNQLRLDNDIAEMSFRGWDQHPSDRRMIADHPEIFSSFYSVPTPSMPPGLVKELREFLLGAMKTLRWLVVGLHQDSGDLLEVFEQWRAWRACHRVSPHGPPDYYRQQRFARDFVRFVRADYLKRRARAVTAIAVLADYEHALLNASLHSKTSARRVRLKIQAAETRPVASDSHPRISPFVRLVRLRGDYRGVIGRLRAKLPLEDVRAQPVTLATRTLPGSGADVLELSSLSAELLRLCNGRRSVLEIAGQFSARKLQVADVPAPQACLFGIELLRRQKLLSVRTSSRAAIPAAREA